MPTRTGDSGGGAEDDLLALWRAVEWRFRRRLLRLGLEDAEAVDDLSQETLRRLVTKWRKGVVGHTERDVLRLAETVALNLVRDRIRAAARRPQLEFTSDVPTEAMLDPDDRAELRATIRERLQALSGHDREALALILRGGPYSSTESSKVSRARPRLRDAFSDLLGVGLVPVAGRLHDRWAAARARVAHSPAVLPAAAGVVVGVMLGGFAVTAADPASIGPPTAAAPTSTTVQGAGTPGALSDEDRIGGGWHATPHGRSERRGEWDRGSDRPAPALPARVSVAIDRSGPKQRARLDLGWSEVIPPGSAWVPVAVYCDTRLGGTACAASDIAGRTPRP